MPEILPITLEPPKLNLDKLPDLESERVQRFHDYEFPYMSIILPTFNCAQILVRTLERILVQDYPSYEVIIIDAGSTDRTLEVIKGFQSEKIQLYTVSGYNRYEMFNKGISQASGTYLTFIMPGEFYISLYTFKTMMEAALDHEMPHMLYCGTLIRENLKPERLLLRPFTSGVLRKGLLPTSLVSCWFHSDIFNSVGKFDTSYEARGGFEFLCRVIAQKTLREVCVKRVLTDSEIFVITKTDIYTHFVENGRAIFKHFGFLSFISWLLSQRDTRRLFSMWLKSIRQAFLGH